MRFSYYKKLINHDKAIYDRSNQVTSLRLHNASNMTPSLISLKRALENEDKAAVTKISQKIVSSLCLAFGVPALQVKVLNKRPSNNSGELHGLYESTGRQSVIKVWMQTAKRRQVVAFKTFLRTLLHELMHHFDYSLLKLPDSFHTEGFYKRESNLFRQLMQ